MATCIRMREPLRLRIHGRARPLGWLATMLAVAAVLAVA
jgi:hypothetical protein